MPIKFAQVSLIILLFYSLSEISVCIVLRTFFSRIPWSCAKLRIISCEHKRINIMDGQDETHTHTCDAQNIFVSSRPCDLEFLLHTHLRLFYTNAVEISQLR